MQKCVQKRVFGFPRAFAGVSASPGHRKRNSGVAGTKLCSSEDPQALSQPQAYVCYPVFPPPSPPHVFSTLFGDAGDAGATQGFQARTSSSVKFGPFSSWHEGSPRRVLTLDCFREFTFFWARGCLQSWCGHWLHALAVAANSSGRRGPVCKGTFKG